MSIRVDAASLIAGKIVVGDAGLGVKGSVIRATTQFGAHGPGALYNDWDNAGDDDSEFCARLLTAPASGSFFMNEDGSFTLTGAADGSYTFSYQLIVDGVDVGSPVTSYIVVGQASVESDLSGAYSISASTTTDLTAAFAVIAAVQRDLAAAYDIEVDGTVLSDLSAAYSVVASVEQDLTAAYSVLSVAQSDLAAGYFVHEAVSADLTAGYAVSVSVERDLAGAYSVASSTPGSCDPADIWGFVLPNGLTAGATLLKVAQQIDELHRIHGLQIAFPLTTTEIARTAGDISQVVSDDGSTVTVQRQ